MSQTLLNLWSAVRPAVGLVFPPAARPADLAGWPPAARAAVHVSVLGALLLVLFGLNAARPFQQLLGGPPLSGPQRVFLPLAFLLTYAVGWLAVGLTGRTPQEASRYPDLDAAWADLLTGLEAAGRPLSAGPVYLLLGKPAGGYDAVARAAGLTVLADLPADPGAPVRAVVCREMTLLAVPGAGAFGPFAVQLNDPAAGPPDPFRATGTMDPRQALTDTAELLNKEFYALLAIELERPRTPDEDARMHELGDRITAARGHARKRFAVSPGLRADGPPRLAHVCRRLAAARRPNLPLDGALALLPWGVLASDEATAAGGPLLAADLAAARAALGQRLPVVTAVCDLEQADGFAAFRGGFSADKRRQRIGQRLPLVPVARPDEYPRVLELTADWVRANVIPAWAVKFVRVDWPPPDDAVWVPADNRELFRFAAGLYTRGPRLGKLLTAAFPAVTGAADPADRYPLLAGCYLVATGKADREQAFVGGVVQRLAEVSGSAGWLPATLAADRADARRAGGLLASAGLLLAATAGLIGLAAAFGR